MEETTRIMRVPWVPRRGSSIANSWLLPLNGSLHLQRRPNAPGRKFFLTDAAQLALSFLAAGHRQNLLEDLPAHYFYGRSFEDNAGIDVHVVDHVIVERRVGRHFDRGSGLATKNGASARRED